MRSQFTPTPRFAPAADVNFCGYFLGSSFCRAQSLRLRHLMLHPAYKCLFFTTGKDVLAPNFVENLTETWKEEIFYKRLAYLPPSAFYPIRV